MGNCESRPVGCLDGEFDDTSVVGVGTFDGILVVSSVFCVGSIDGNIEICIEEGSSDFFISVGFCDRKIENSLIGSCVLCEGLTDGALEIVSFKTLCDETIDDGTSVGMVEDTFWPDGFCVDIMDGANVVTAFEGDEVSNGCKVIFVLCGGETSVMLGVVKFCIARISEGANDDTIDGLDDSIDKLWA